jgi:hypothetical protein
MRPSAQRSLRGDWLHRSLAFENTGSGFSRRDFDGPAYTAEPPRVGHPGADATVAAARIILGKKPIPMPEPFAWFTISLAICCRTRARLV